MRRVTVVAATVFSLAVIGCQPKDGSSAAGPSSAATANDEPTLPASSVEKGADQGSAEHLTSELRDAMTPEDVYQAFKDGHARFINGDLRYRRLMTEVKEGDTGQSPHAIVVSCIDSRVPAETIFDKRIGDMFSTRIAGNVINEDVLGGLEFATQFAGAKLIMVMGHTKCGAVKGAVAHVDHGNLTALVKKIEPSVESVSSTFEGEADPDNYEFVDAVAEAHVKHSIEEIRQNSPELKRMEEEGKIKIVGTMYSVSNGRVTFYD